MKCSRTMPWFHGRRIGLFTAGRVGSEGQGALPQIDIASLRSRDRKIFCIGFPKTGTTSLESALGAMGATLGNQAVGEMLAEDWANARIDRIIGFCHTADAFQDLPFSMPGLYRHLDREFPGSKFILTVRNDEDQWFNSLVRFHSKLFGDGVRPPTEEMLAKAPYRYRGFVLDTRKMFWGYPDVNLYDREHYQHMYRQHISDVVDYFCEHETESTFLQLNVAERNSYQKLAKFLGVQLPDGIEFPWLNRT